MSSEVAKRQQLSIVTKDNELSFPFLKLPNELRNMIYELLVFEFEQCISITSTSRKKGPKKNIRSILRVNKQIHQEARIVFYSLNHFVVGNCWYGSTKGVNLQALKLFVQRVPKDCIAKIKTLWVQLVFHPIRQEGRPKRRQYYMDSRAIQDFTEVCKIIEKHFKGLERLGVMSTSGNSSVSKRIVFSRPKIWQVEGPESKIGDAIDCILRSKDPKSFFVSHLQDLKFFADESERLRQILFGGKLAPENQNLTNQSIVQ